MKKLIFISILFASCQEYKSPETKQLEMELDSIQKVGVMKADSLNKIIENGSTKTQPLRTRE